MPANITYCHSMIAVNCYLVLMLFQTLDIFSTLWVDIIKATKNHNLFGNYLQTWRIQQSQSVSIWNIIDYFPWASVNIIHFYFINEIVRLKPSKYGIVFQFFTTKDEEVLIIERADTKLLSSSLKCRDICPSIFLNIVNLTCI
jgi:hypothetical protein